MATYHAHQPNKGVLMQGLQSRRPHSWRLIVSFVAAAAVLSTSLSACTTPITGSADSTASSSNKLQAPTEESPSGEITIWDRSGDLFGVFENTIADFNKKYPNIKVHHEAVDIDASPEQMFRTEYSLTTPRCLPSPTTFGILATY